MKLPVIGFLFPAGVLFFLAVTLGLSLVWLNIERMDTAYSFKQMSTESVEKEDLLAKLTIERDNLLAPYRLKALAKNYGLRPADAGQIRRLPR